MDFDNAIKNIGANTAYEWCFEPTSTLGRVEDFVENGIIKENWFYSQEDAVGWLAEAKTVDVNFFDGVTLELKRFVFV